MAGRSTSGCGVNTFEAQTSEIEFVDERFNDSHRVVFANVVVQALGQLRDLGSILAFDESLHVVARSDVATIRATGLKPSTRFYTAWTKSRQPRKAAFVPVDVKARQDGVRRQVARRAANADGRSFPSTSTLAGGSGPTSCWLYHCINAFGSAGLHR